MRCRAPGARIAAGARRVAERFARASLWRGGWRQITLLAVAGAVAALALPPLGIVPALFTFALLLSALERSGSARQAFLCGWAFAFGYHVAGLYWISNALLVDGPRFAWAVPFAAAGLPAGLALYGGLAALLYRRLGPRGWLRGPVLAAAWTLGEVLRGNFATGFPWNLPASVWSFSDAMLQPLALFGGYGYSFFVLLFALSPLMLLGRGAAERGLGLVLLLLPAAFAASGALRLHAAPGLQASAPVVRIVQGNIPQRDKWQPELLRAHLAKHALLTRAARADVRPEGMEAEALAPPELVVWPETAVPFPLDRAPELAESLGALLPGPGGLFMTGVPLRAAMKDVTGENVPGAYRNYNAVVGLDRDGALVARHDKFHLVPFGEYTPLRDWLPLGPVVGQGFTAGAGPTLFSRPGLPEIGVLICYEIVFPGAVIPAAGPRPGVLVNVTNDAWFGVSSGPHQHLAAARMRAVEEGIPVIRAANTGISAVIDAHGRVLARLPLGLTGVIDSPLPAALPDVTPYAAFGETATFLFIFLPLLMAGCRRSGYRSGSSKKRNVKYRERLR